MTSLTTHHQTATSQIKSILAQSHEPEGKVQTKAWHACKFHAKHAASKA